MPELQLPLPPGYRSLVPLDREEHRGLGVSAPQASFASRLNAIHVTTAEFYQVSRHYPIAFARDTSTGQFLPVAVTSFGDADNQFVDSQGHWRAGVYVPAYVRRYPFYPVPVRRGDDHDEPDFLICIDETGLSPTAPALFDPQGEPTETWKRLETLIRDGERARLQTERFTRAIAELGILEGFEAHAQANTGGLVRLGSLSRVNEQKLNALSVSALKALMQVGALSSVYAHLISLDNFAALLEST